MKRIPRVKIMKRSSEKRAREDLQLNEHNEFEAILTTKKRDTADRHSEVIIEGKVAAPEEVTSLQLVHQNAVVVQTLVDLVWPKFLVVCQFLQLQSDLDEALRQYSASQVQVDDRTK